MTSHVSKKSGLIPASSVTATTPAPGKATGLSPSPYHGSFGGLSQNQDPPPPFLFVDSLKPIEIVVSFTAFSRWLDPPQPVIRERDKEKEKEKDSNSIVTGENWTVELCVSLSSNLHLNVNVVRKLSPIYVNQVFYSKLR